MLNPDQAIDRVAQACERAKKAGADAADARCHADSATGIGVRLGALEDAERSESQSLSLRVFVGQRSASVSTADMDPASIAALVDRAVAMARAAPEDPYAGLAPADALLTGAPPALDLDDHSDGDPVAMRQAALRVEEAARAVSGVTNSEGGSSSHHRIMTAYATTHGFAAAVSGTSHSISASVLAGEGADMQRDYAWHNARHAGDLESPEDVGTRAGERAVRRMNPGRLSSGAMPVLFDPRVAGSLVGHLIGAIAGPAIARGTSFLLGHEEDQLFAPGFAIEDDPLRPRGLASRPFDAEGVGTAPRRLIDDGRLTGWLMDAASARQLGLAPTGHASGHGVSASNVHIVPGTVTPAQLMADIKDGVLITELIGQGVNPVTGDYSRGASGFRIIDGAVGEPVAEFTVAGNLRDIYAALRAADDLRFRQAINSPTLRCDALTIASA